MRLLDFLDTHNAKASFFVVGSRVQQYKSVAREILKRGHDLGNHSWSHPNLAKRSHTSFLNEVDRCTRLLEDVTGETPRLFRPPYGAIRQDQVNFLAVERNLHTIMWSVDTEDWKRPGVNVVIDRIVKGTRHGNITLCHDIHHPTVTASEYALAHLQHLGLPLAKITDMIDMSNAA
jgi:peptidoglycan/xylan/chitin deacetylase (PgdA/CDA1 family)